MSLSNPKFFLPSIRFNSKIYAKGVTYVYAVEFSKDYEIWMDLRQTACYQFDWVLAGRPIILRVKYSNMPENEW